MLLKTRIGLGLAAAATLWMGSVVAHADNAAVAERQSRWDTVSFADLDLRQPSNVARLYRRLTAAADRACGPRAFNVFYYTLPKYQACVADAVQKAVAHINDPALSTYYQQQRMQSGLIFAQR